jgi:hypothetical protein
MGEEGRDILWRCYKRAFHSLLTMNKLNEMFCLGSSVNSLYHVACSFSYQWIKQASHFLLPSHIQKSCLAEQESDSSVYPRLEIFPLPMVNLVGSYFYFEVCLTPLSFYQIDLYKLISWKLALTYSLVRCYTDVIYSSILITNNYPYLNNVRRASLEVDFWKTWRIERYSPLNSSKPFNSSPQISCIDKLKVVNIFTSLRVASAGHFQF